VRILRRGQRVIAPWAFSDGTCDLGTVIPLEDVPAGYAAMDERRAVKALVRTGAA
jgi:hypothetical protein